MAWNEAGVVRVLTDRGTRRVPLDGADPVAALAVVRRLREEVPHDLHKHWRFGRRRALRMLRCERPDRPLRSFERVVDGSISPWLPVAGMLVGEAAGLGLRLLTGDPVFLIVGPALGLMLAALRRYTVRIECRRIEAVHPEAKWGTAGAVLLMVLLFGGMIVCRLRLVPDRVLICWLGLLVVAMFAGFYIADRRTAPFRAARDAEEEAEWAALTATPQRTPGWQAALWEPAEPAHA